METRRDFIRKTSLAAGAMMLSSGGCQTSLRKEKMLPVSRQQKPLAIVMWDFSRILRHHKGIKTLV